MRKTISLGRKNTIKIEQQLLDKLGLSDEEFIARIMEIQVNKRSLLALIEEDNYLLLCTTNANLRLNYDLTIIGANTPNVGFMAGNNQTGHKLPACSNGYIR